MYGLAVGKTLQSAGRGWIHTMFSCELVGVWFFWSLALQQYSSSTALSYSSPPQNVSHITGESATFLCGVSPESVGLQLNFTIHSRHGNITIQCPGETTLQLTQVLKGHCQVQREELRAVWTFASTTNADNGTSVVCQCTGLPPTYGQLTVRENSGYFTTLIGCVIGGFFGILLVFSLAYLGLMRSERFQRCFKGRTPQEDISAIIEESK